MDDNIIDLGISSESFDEIIARNNLQPNQSASVLFNFIAIKFSFGTSNGAFIP